MVKRALTSVYIGDIVDLARELQMFSRRITSYFKCNYKSDWYIKEKANSNNLDAGNIQC